MIRARQLRLDRGLTVVAVSEATGVNRKTIVRLEDGTGEAQAPTLKALGDFYGVPASSLTLDAVDSTEAAA
jgi:transcriptional regulator with XRE-family HTH domain